MQKSIAIIGQGFVGGSLTTVFSERGIQPYVFDKDPTRCAPGGLQIKKLKPTSTDVIQVPEDSFEKFVLGCEQIKGFTNIFFVCLPTPMYEDGECDISIVEGVLKDLSQIPGNRIAVVKSTIPPGSTERWNTMFKNSGLRVVHNPEFLTEANAVNDMRNQNRIVLGGPRPYINSVKQIFQSAFPNVPIIKTSSTTSEMVKYFTNIQLAARVVLSCEISQVCVALDSQGLNVDYDKVLEYAKYDQRLGGTHMNVPGQDGISGARGHCFPKDLNALISVAKQMRVKPTIMEAIWEKNLEVIPKEHRDWEKMADRAVSKKK